MTNFNKEEFYNEEIEKRVIELKQICAREKLPMFICICTQNDKNGTIYKKDMISPTTHGIELKENLIPKFVDVTLGFETVQPRQDIEIEF